MGTKMSIEFLGAARTATGSMQLVRAGDTNVLVDCGLFQGRKALRLNNRASLPLRARELDAAILTTAELDHSGYLPVLVRDGFSGPVYCSEATRDLCQILLRDAAQLHEEDASHANDRGYSNHGPALPLYTVAEADRALASLVVAPVGVATALPGGLSFTLLPAGRLLGATMVLVEDSARAVLFTGTLGRPGDSLIKAPVRVRNADYLVLGSTSCNGTDDEPDPDQSVAQLLSRVAARSGVLLVPAPCVGRVEALLLQLARLKAAGRVPPVPIFLDSPMATETTVLYARHRSEHRLHPDECAAMCGAAQLVRSVEESRRLDEQLGPMVIIAGSEMASGGRILHHLAAFAGDARNAILLTGFQAADTRGAALAAGARKLRIHGEWVEVGAEVVQLHGASSRACGNESVAWLEGFERAPLHTYLVDGEELAALALKRRVEEQLHWRVSVPALLQRVDLAEGAGVDRRDLWFEPAAPEGYGHLKSAVQESRP